MELCPPPSCGYAGRPRFDWRSFLVRDPGPRTRSNCQRTSATRRTLVDCCTRRDNVSSPTRSKRSCYGGRESEGTQPINHGEGTPGGEHFHRRQVHRVRSFRCHLAKRSGRANPDLRRQSLCRILHPGPATSLLISPRKCSRRPYPDARVKLRCADPLRAVPRTWPERRGSSLPRMIPAV